MIKILKADNGHYYFVVLAKNNATLATSEMYPRKRNAVRGARALLDSLEYQGGGVIVDKTA